MPRRWHSRFCAIVCAAPRALRLFKRFGTTFYVLHASWEQGPLKHCYHFTRPESARTLQLHQAPPPRNVAKGWWLLRRHQITARRRFVHALPIADNGSR